MNIDQLSVRYQPEQDRILLSLNTSEGQNLTGTTPLLATEITLSPQEGQKVQVHFKEQLSPTEPVRGVQFDLQTTLLFSLVQLLGQALEHTQWQAGLRAIAAEPDDAATELAETRPIYPN